MMKRMNVLAFAGFILSATLCITSQPAVAQYPTGAEFVKADAEGKRRDAAADARSNEAWQRAQPELQEWAAKGKPFIPWARNPSDLPQASIPAFPGAEGGGAFSFGGRGGKVIVVTSLEDSGPGTLRDACEQAGPRIVVFNVAGIIQLKDRLRVRAPYITIAGNTAPGDGVCVAGATFMIDTHDVVIRYMRFRRGQTFVGQRDDSLGGNPVGNMIFDHVSGSWGLDENMSMYRHMYQPPTGGKELKLPTVNITFQNCIFAEGLNTYHHAFGSTIGGYNSTFMRNLWSCNSGRNPSVGMNGDFGFVNNVLFNWVHRTVDGGDDVSYFNIINNYFKPGPATPKDKAVGHRILKPESSRDKSRRDQFGKAYVNGNIVEGDEAISKDNWAGGVQLADQGDPGYSPSGDPRLQKIRVDSPFPMARVTIMPAQEAFTFVLDHAGATLPRRDPVDARIIESVRTGKTVARPSENSRELLTHAGYNDRVIEEQIALISKGIITDPVQVGGYPEYKGEPYKDSDNDGMPDAWETKVGLNPNDASDATKDLNGDGYANIEKFLNGLDPAKKIDWKDLRNNIDTLSASQPTALAK